MILRITGKVLPNDGLLITDSGKKTDLNKKLFPLTKLQKIWKWKSFLWILITESPKNIFNPVFWQYHVPVAQLE